MHRVQGWRNIKDLLYNGRLFFFEGTTERILSSIGTVQRDDKNPEDVKRWATIILLMVFAMALITCGRRRL